MCPAALLYSNVNLSLTKSIAIYAQLPRRRKGRQLSLYEYYSCFPVFIKEKSTSPIRGNNWGKTMFLNEKEPRNHYYRIPCWRRMLTSVITPINILCLHKEHGKQTVPTKRKGTFFGCCTELIGFFNGIHQKGGYSLRR